MYVLEKRTTTATEVTSDVSVNMKYYLIYYDEDNIDINLGLAFEESETLDWNEIFENAQKHPEQNQINEVIGIDEYGNPVNMDLWHCEKTEDELGYCLGYYHLSGYLSAYLGQIIDGRIEGKIPKYIKQKNDDKFYSVTVLAGTFAECTSLTEAPVIPDSVTEMNGTFALCTGLTKASTIPNSVRFMRRAFMGCTNLTGTLEINANPYYMYDDCFLSASTSDNANLILTGSSTMLQELLETKSEDSHITIQE